MLNAASGLRAALVTLLAAVGGLVPAAPPHRGPLPAATAPIRYDIDLTPDAAHLSFTGSVRIAFAQATPAPAVVLNAADLEIKGATLDDAPARAVLDAKAQTATFSTGTEIAAGRHRLSIVYRGRILQRAAGLFAVDAHGPHGPSRTLVTQFEPSDARRLIPCFDEPDAKAEFSLSVTAPKGRMAVSNMPVEREEALAGGLQRTRFFPTPKMSTYTLFLGVGDFERVARRVEGVDVGVVVPRGQTARAAYALDAATRILRDYNAYFGVRYPLPKLDLIAPPGDVGAAMENWGAMLFGQGDLLIDSRLSTESDRRAATLLIAHEMAHQWFGNLVTPAWWDDLWLNEAFASWMSTRELAVMHPEWKPWLHAMSETEEAMGDDALPTAHAMNEPVGDPTQAAEAFDSTTYEKGQAVVRMLEAYAGEPAFRRGLRRYMRMHAYSNVTGDDLWREIELASPRQGVAMVARDFVQQPGIPLIKADASGPMPSPSGLIESATPLAPIKTTGSAPASAPVWRIPISVAESSLEGAQRLDAGRFTYSRIAYTPDRLAAIARGFAGLPPADQIGAINDAWALGLVGMEPTGDAFDLIARLPVDDEPEVWQRAIAVLGQADDLHDDGKGREALHAYARNLLAPLQQRLGWDAKPGEASGVAPLRSALAGAMVRYGDEDARAQVRRRFDLYLARPDALDPETRATVLRIMGRRGLAADYDALLAQARAERDTFARERLYLALARSADADLAKRTLALALTDEIPAHRAGAMVLRVAEQHPDLAWRFALANRAALEDGLDAVSRTEFLADIAVNSFDPARAKDLADADPAGGSVAHARATILFNARIRSARLPELDRWVLEHGRTIAKSS